MLRILGGIYGKAADLRNALYEKGVFRSHQLPVPVISIGNITAGGTGKTPLVAFTAEALSDSGHRVCVVSRGYKRGNEKELVAVSDGEKILTEPRNAGDEPFELAKKLLGKASVVCDANRVRGGTFAIEELGAEVIVLDDAFQHRRIRRDLDVVVIDATDPFGGGKAIPAGRLREPLSHLSRADLFVVTRSDLVPESSNTGNRLAKYNDSAPVFLARTETAGLCTLEDFQTGADAAPLIPEGPFLVFCGIGNSDALFRQLEREGTSVSAHIPFRDHITYGASEIAAINSGAKRSNASALLTTAKDAVKLVGAEFELPCYVLKSRLIIEDEPAFRDSLLQAAIK